MPPPAEMPSPVTLTIASPSGPLELLACLPDPPTKRPPLLFVHGAHCAAACFKAILPLTAHAGHASYALSLRGHGRSWQPGVFAFHALTGIDAYVADVVAGINFLGGEHPDTAPILVGHSMGGGVMQRLLATVGGQGQGARQLEVGGLVLLASAPLTGGGLDVARNWQAAEAALAKEHKEAPAAAQGWLPWLRSFFVFKVNTGVDTPAQVRNKFFSPEAPEDVVCGWIRDSKGRLESIRVAIDIFWPIADASAVLAAIARDSPPVGRKVLVISAEKDVLVPSEVSRRNFDAYRLACQGEEEVLQVELPGSAHHIMLDIAYERCAEVIVRWLQQQSL